MPQKINVLIETPFYSTDSKSPPTSSCASSSVSQVIPFDSEHSVHNQQEEMREQPADTEGQHEEGTVEEPTFINVEAILG